MATYDTTNGVKQMYTSTDGEFPIHVVLEVADHADLRDLLQTIQREDIEAKTEDIAPAPLFTNSTVQLDLDILTDKQRQALELALDSGYYDQPRETCLTDLAEELGITESAVSQRIRNAERKLVKHVFRHYL